jgi:hypothetical protein
MSATLPEGNETEHARVRGDQTLRSRGDAVVAATPTGTDRPLSQRAPSDRVRRRRQTSATARESRSTATRRQECCPGTIAALWFALDGAAASTRQGSSRRRQPPLRPGAHPAYIAPRDSFVNGRPSRSGRLRPPDRRFRSERAVSGTRISCAKAAGTSPMQRQSSRRVSLIARRSSATGVFDRCCFYFYGRGRLINANWPVLSHTAPPYRSDSRRLDHAER